MLWLHKPAEVVKEVKVTEYIPVSLSDTRPRSVKWTDKGYLTNAVDLGKNQVYKTEILNAIAELDKIRNMAEDSQHMKGLNAGMSMLKQLLIVGEMASKQIESLNDMESIQNADGVD